MGQGRPDPALLRYCWCSGRSPPHGVTRSQGRTRGWRLHVCATACSRNQSEPRRTIWVRNRSDHGSAGQPGDHRTPQETGRGREGAPPDHVLDGAEGPCPTASSTCPLQGSGYDAPRQARAAGGRHVCALHVRANLPDPPRAGSGRGRGLDGRLDPLQGGAEPVGELRSWPAAPPMTGPSSVVPTVKAGRSRRAVSRVPDPVPLELVGPGGAALAGAPGDRPAGLPAGSPSRWSARRRAAAVEAEQRRAHRDRRRPSTASRRSSGLHSGIRRDVADDLPDLRGGGLDVDGDADRGSGRCGAVPRSRSRPISASQPLSAAYTSGWLSRSKWSPLMCSTSAPGNISGPRRGRPVAEG